MHVCKEGAQWSAHVNPVRRAGADGDGECTAMPKSMSETLRI